MANIVPLPATAKPRLAAVVAVVDEQAQSMAPMAPATGIICAELDRFLPRQNMRIGRISLDILGLIPAGEFEIVTRVIRPGKTIELLESEMWAKSKVCIVARTCAC